MAKDSSKGLSEILKQLLLILLGLLLGVGLQSSLQVLDYFFPAEAIARMPANITRSLLWIMLFLLLASWLAAYRLWSSNTLRRKRSYRFDPEIGVYRRKKDDLPYCTSCMDKDGIETPLLERPNGWHCMVKGCGKEYLRLGEKSSNAAATADGPPQQRPTRWSKS